jgi:beta-lactamase class D
MVAVQLSLALFALSSEPAVVAERDLSGHFKNFQGCFILLNVAKGEVTKFKPEQCAQRHAPCSTFKVPNSLIGLDAGVLRGPDHPFPWDGQARRFSSWNRDHDLRSAIRHSVVWFYQRLATELGMKRMQEGLARLRYGNQDTSAGLTQFWLSSSLKISADEQVRFLRDLQSGVLPFSSRSQRVVRDIMVEERQHGWTLHGKTGTGALPGTDDAVNGWYVGWTTHETDAFVFACRIAANRGATGRTARRIALGILRELGAWPRN